MELAVLDHTEARGLATQAELGSALPLPLPSAVGRHAVCPCTAATAFAGLPLQRRRRLCRPPDAGSLLRDCFNFWYEICGIGTLTVVLQLIGIMDS